LIEIQKGETMRRRTISATLAGIAGSVLLFGTPLLIGGCGSSGKAPAIASAGRAAITVRWPERSDSRLIPFAANSIRVRVLKGTSELGTALLIRPTNGGQASANFDRLPVGAVTMEATAYPGNDGSGVGQASAQTTVTIIAGQTIPVALTLASTIDKVEVTPSPAALNSGQTAQLTATAKNAAGEIVLTQGATVEWTSKNASVATVEPGGLVRAVASGSAVIEAKETESGKVGSVTLTVNGSSGGFIFNPDNGHYYKVFSAPGGITWENARLEAHKQGGYLASITSAAENQFVFSVSDSPAYWQIRSGFQIGPWIGGIRFAGPPAASVGHRWITGEPFTYSNWDTNQPDFTDGTEDKIHFEAVGGQRAAKWNDLANNVGADNPISYVVEFDYNPATSTAVYANDFETGAGAEWSKTNIFQFPSNQRRILGRFGNETVSLNLNSLPTHSKVVVSFDLYPINSWDGRGSSVGEEIWDLSVAGGSTLIHTNFNNSGDEQQSYPGTHPQDFYLARSTAIEFTHTPYRYSLYRVTRIFDHTGGTLTLNFSGSNLESLDNESWGIDNIDVRTLP
jgi:hypothetical protein